MIDKYLWPDDPWACSEPAEVRRIYEEKLRIANLLRPSSVAEIGVRAGYTAAMFLLAGAEAYVGLDATDRWGGAPGAVDFARASLPVHFPTARIAIHTLDTQAVSTLSNFGTAELVHIDGDHSLAGCLHDLELALTLNPLWVLVDDIFHHPESCKLAAEAFASRYSLRSVLLPTLRGDWLFQIQAPLLNPLPGVLPRPGRDRPGTAGPDSYL